MNKILVIGAEGQFGSELTNALRLQYGPEAVIAADIKTTLQQQGPFEILDVLDKEQLYKVIKKYEIDQVYNLAAVLSAKAEFDPQFAWHLNVQGLLNVLDLAKEGHISKIYWPSSIAVFGPDTPPKNTPQNTLMNPNTIYGISKLAGERWCEYYYSRYEVDVRSIRYPGLIGYKTAPGGGTTDYAVHIFLSAVQGESYTCYLKPDTCLPMMYMDDAVRGTINLMGADSAQVKIRSSYNLAAMSFSPKDIYKEIKRFLPNFEISYVPDYRQEIAEGWPASIDDNAARKDWGWQPQYDLTHMTREIIEHLEVGYAPQGG